MRNCKFVKRMYEYTPSGKRELVAKEYDGIFVMWGNDFVEFDTGCGIYTAGVIESDSGKVELIRADDITFTDKGG